MKKSIFVFIVCLFGVMSHAEESVFQYITEDLRHTGEHPQWFVTNGHFYSYEGWVDSTGTRKCYGGVLNGSEVLLSGQVQNGIFDGWCWSSEIGFNGIMKWQDSSKTVVPVGWGKCDYPVPNVANQSQPGLVITDGQNYYITEQGEQLNALVTYEKLLYDNNKQYIKKVCAKKGLKYVEDVHLGILSYTGGWKDGQPYMFGAYKDHPDSYSWHRNKVVFCGYFTYEPKDIVFTADNRGDWTEYHHVQYNPFVFHQHIISTDSVTLEQVITDIEINFDHYTKCISEKGYVKEYEALNFKKGIYSKGTAIDSAFCWGIIVGKNELYEGTIGFDYGKLYNFYGTKSGKSISNKGDIRDATFKDEKIKFFKFNNGDMFIQKAEYDWGYALGEYVFSNGSYTIGLFKINSSWSSSDGYKPVYAEAYDKNDEIIKSYVDLPRGFNATKIEEQIQKLKIEHKTPICGSGSVIGDNYKYEGEFYARLYHGKGRLSYNDGTYKDGIWEKGEFVSGKAYYKNKSGEYVGELKGTSPHGKGKFTYNDGTYKDGTWNNGTFVEGKASYKTKSGEYMGEMKGASPHGQGKFTFNNGGYLDGILDNGDLISGEEYKIYDDGTTFKGVREHGYATQGTFTAIDGSKVVRTWRVVNSELYGSTGYIQSSNNEHIDIFYANKSEYHGPVRNGQLIGDSVVVIDSIDNQYIGGWNELGRTGAGTDVFANGDTIRTTWADNVGVQDAEYTYIWADGRKFVGVVGKKGKIGKGVYYNADGTEAPKKDSKNWVMQTPGAMDIHVLPVDRAFP